MNRKKLLRFHAGCLLPLLLGLPAAWAQPTACEQAWAEYNDFKERSRMEASQYPLTLQGAAVRAACGEAALPVPPGSDVPPPPRVRKPKPVPPPPPPPRRRHPAPIERAGIAGEPLQPSRSSATASATLMPSTPADRMPPA